MPELFYKRIKEMRLYSTLQMLSICSSFFFGGLFIECLFIQASGSVMGFFGCSAAISIAGFAATHHVLNKKETMPPYVVRLAAVTLDQIVAGFGADPVAEGAYFCFARRDGITIRTLIQYQNRFDKTELMQQRKRCNRSINQSYGVSAWGTMTEVSKRARLNLIVCGHYDEGLYKMISKKPDNMLRRNESIVTAALFLDRQELILPACFCDLTLHDLKKYQVLLEYAVFNCGNKTEI